MTLVERYLSHISAIRRYSERTCELYKTILEDYFTYVREGDEVSDEVEYLQAGLVRRYEVHLLDERGFKASTVNLHLSVLSGLCRFLISEGLLEVNPIRQVSRPRQSKRLPVFFRKESMDEYMKDSLPSSTEENLELIVGDDKTSQNIFLTRQRRLIVSILYQTGMRRSELIGLKLSNIDLTRKVIRVTGKGNKMREIPLLSSLCKEISLYLAAASSLMDDVYNPEQPLIRTLKGEKIYPMYVDRAVKKELSGVDGVSGRRSPHVLRHTLATELLDDGSDLNSIKELLGHSSLAATQVYTHNSIEKLQKVYNHAHPRAKNGGNNGD